MTKLLEKMRFEITDYEQDYRLCPNPGYKLSEDERYLFFHDVLDRTQDLRLHPSTVSVLCSVDGLLYVCWELCFVYGCSIKRALLKAAIHARNGAI